MRPGEAKGSTGDSSPSTRDTAPDDRSESSPDYLAIARIQRGRGLKGEVKALILTDFPERFSLLDEVYVGDEPRLVQLEYSRVARESVILKFGGYDDRTQADTLRGEHVWVPITDAVPLAEGVYYIYEIIGLTVRTVDGEYLGQVDDILFTGGNDVYVVKDGEHEILIPMIEQVVRKVDLAQGEIRVKLIEGLR